VTGAERQSKAEPDEDGKALGGSAVHYKRLRWKTAVNRLTLEVSRIIRGDSGKARTGWLAWPLLSRIVRFGSGGRIHQFL
jgi:hypothetical protein